MKTITITKKIDLYNIDELKDSAKYNAIENVYNSIGSYGLVDNCFLLELPQKEIDKRIKENKRIKDFYSKNGILLKNTRQIYFDVDENFIDLTKAVKIKDISIFLEFIGIDPFPEKEYLMIYDFDFSSNGGVYFERYTQNDKEEEEQEVLINLLHSKIEEIENYTLERINQNYEYYCSEEYILEDQEANNYMFLENGGIFYLESNEYTIQIKTNINQ